MTETSLKPVAKYLQLCDILKKDIIKGVYPQGGKLPTCRELTTLLGASYLTITNALRELEQEGYVRRLHGKGIFVKKIASEPIKKTIKVGYFVDVKVSIFAHFFTAVLEELNRLPIYNVPVNMPSASIKTTLAENEAWMDDVFHNRFNSMVIFGDRHFPFKTLMRYRNEVEQLNFIFLDNSSLSFPAANRILVDFEKAGYLAAKRFLETGHRKMAVLSISRLNEMYCRQMGIKKQDHGLDILDGVERAYKESGIDFFSNVKVVNDSNKPSDEERCLAELKSCFQDGFTAFFAVGDNRARKIYAIAKEFKKTVGNDIVVIGLYNTPACTILNPSLSSISLNENEVGRIAAQAIREDWRGKTVMVEPELIIRNSC